MKIEISDRLYETLLKLSLCQDSRTGERVFLGTVRVSFENNEGLIDLEDPSWETAASGDVIRTGSLRVPEHLKEDSPHV